MLADAALPAQPPVLTLAGALPPLGTGWDKGAPPEIAEGDELSRREQSGNERAQPGGDARLLKELLEAPVMSLARRPATQALASETNLQAT